jgi:hypothetical protein
MHNAQSIFAVVVTKMSRQKTGGALAIPITVELAAAVNATPSEAMMFLLNDTAARSPRKVSGNGSPRSVSASG